MSETGVTDASSSLAPEANTLEGLMARRNSSALLSDLFRVVQRPEFMSEFVARNLFAYAGLDLAT